MKRTKPGSDGVANLLDKLAAAGRVRLEPPDGAWRFNVGEATCGLAAGAGPVMDALRSGFADEEAVVLVEVGCIGLCAREPLVEGVSAGRRMLYGPVKPEKAVELALGIRDGGAPDGALRVIEQGRVISQDGFFEGQVRVAMANCGVIDPGSLDEYVAMGGYRALAHALEGGDPCAILEQIETSGLRGRGGAGFPTGRKWRLGREAEGEEKYLVCNADEGDPGAYMDRAVLEGDPFAILEGMTIGAYVVGAGRGFIYVRAEYPLAIARLQHALEVSRDTGLLGESILGSGLAFDIQLVPGAGAFVCGEETALIASVEGRVGEPRRRPPYPVERGLWGNPTVINNVETWANVPRILTQGADRFRSLGSEGSGGTKVFSLVGKVEKTGLVEVPLGTPLRKVVMEMGGGVPGGKRFKAVQTGGPSGGCLPEELIDLPVDYEQLAAAGSMMGSGGMIVMDETTCMVDVARYFMDFLRGESCGKCTPCREGTAQMYRLLDEICSGHGTEEHLQMLENLGTLLKDTSLCQLGATAANPVLSTIRHFRDEYDAHIREKRCPAGVCRALITYEIDPEKCDLCRLCIAKCPVDAIAEGEDTAMIKADVCTKCGVCFRLCKRGAVVLV
jgi:NADH:ubiquinone oxidoreductase subunit F (NADH-binding)/Pyruvate/2-oxoacid:ferredoxin oxidoreductase delta subunit